MRTDVVYRVAICSIAAAFAAGGVDRVGRGGRKLVPLAVHRVLRQVVGLDREERAHPYVQRDAGRLDAPGLQFGEKFGREVQPGRRGRHGAGALGVDGLVAVGVVGYGDLGNGDLLLFRRLEKLHVPISGKGYIQLFATAAKSRKSPFPPDVRRQGRLADLFQHVRRRDRGDDLHLPLALAFVDGQFDLGLGRHQRQSLAYAAARRPLEQHLPESGRQLAEEQAFDLPARRTPAEELCRQDLSVIDDQQVALAKQARKLVEDVVRNACGGAVQDHQSRRRALGHRGLCDQGLVQGVVVRFSPAMTLSIAMVVWPG